MKKMIMKKNAKVMKMYFSVVILIVWSIFNLMLYFKLHKYILLKNLENSM